jgi:hypothetical protein
MHFYVGKNFIFVKSGCYSIQLLIALLQSQVNKMATPLGTDSQMSIIGADDGIGNSIAGLVGVTTVEGGIGSVPADSLEVAVVDAKGVKLVPDGTKISTENVIGINMDDLSKKDLEEVERELQRELKEEMVERCKKKLDCLQKTRDGVVKKSDMVKASIPANALFTLEELVHMIGVSVSSKYGADLEAIT